MDKPLADQNPDAPQPSSDEHLGAVEGDRATDAEPGNRNAGALDDQGLPKDRIAICEDVLGANNDETQG